MKHKKINNKAFTLIELIVVMAIIAVLVLLAAPRFLGYTKDANVTAMQQDTKVLADASELYHIDKNEWPIIGEAITGHGIGGVDEVYPIDKTKLESSIKNIKGNYEDYAIAVDGKYKGQVLHLGGMVDKHGESHYSYNISQKGRYTNLEIKEFESQGYKLVVTAKDLDNVRNDLGGHYIQVADIDLSHIDNFEPIGDYSTSDINSSFTGVYDGGGFTISNLTINKPNRINVGLFGRLEKGTIKNVEVINTNIIGNSKVGGLAGIIFDGSTVENSFSTGVVKGSGTRVGGLTGEVYENSILKKSYSTSDVHGQDMYVGGLSGLNNNSIISDSYATGNVVGENSRTGGLVGASYGLIKNSYAIGNVNAGLLSGGLVGEIYNREENTSLIESSYSPSNGLDLVGHHGSGIKENNIIKDSKELTKSDLQTKETYLNWDFDKNWVFEAGSYPTLKWQR